MKAIRCARFRSLSLSLFRSTYSVQIFFTTLFIDFAHINFYDSCTWYSIHCIKLRLFLTFSIEFHVTNNTDGISIKRKYIHICETVTKYIIKWNLIEAVALLFIWNVIFVSVWQSAFLFALDHFNHATFASDFEWKVKRKILIEYPQFVDLFMQASHFTFMFLLFSSF